jgi:hypothetical protein
MNASESTAAAAECNPSPMTRCQKVVVVAAGLIVGAGLVGLAILASRG